MYYQLKLTAQNDMSKDFSEKQRERFYTGDMYARWECIFSLPCFAEFMLTAPYYFPEGYIEGLSLIHISIQEAKDLANVLNSGKVPAPAKIIQDLSLIHI